MKKIQLALVAVFLGVLLLPVAALPALALTSSSTQPDPITGSVGGLVTKLENLVWLIFGLFVIVCFTLAAILFLTANGDPEKVKSARSAFIWGVAGVIVGIIGWSIIAIINGFLAPTT